ncbi:MAG: hypothetical protein IBX41_04620, partial [Methanophagales archaeon]|nr:hypothetical protein [Methanophagales archaeon]
YYAYHVEKRKHAQSTFDRFIRRPLEWFFLDTWCGYGVKPLNPILWAIGFIGSFAFLYWWIEVEGRWKSLRASVKNGVKRLEKFVYRLIKCKENEKSATDSSLMRGQKRLSGSLKDRLKRVLEFVFLSVSIFTTHGKWNDWEPAEKNKPWFSFFAIIEVLLGWILMTLFIISLTLTWIR